MPDTYLDRSGVSYGVGKKSGLHKRAPSIICGSLVQIPGPDSPGFRAERVTPMYYNLDQNDLKSKEP